MKPERLRILLVDRNGGRRRRLLSKLYEVSRCPTVVTAVSGDRELRATPNATFDLCVLSLSSRLDPVEAAKALQVEHPDLPIITVGDDVEPAELGALLAHGVHDHVPRRCTECPAQRRLASSVEWTVERNRLLRHVEEVLEESERRALHDPLTRLPNRKLFVDRLQHLIQCSTRTEASFAVLFVDLDRFKRINDTLGHEVGDRILCEVARRLESSVRGSDTCARWGGDEFLVTLEGARTRTAAAAVARKIAATLAEPIPIGGRELEITASVGISLWPEDGETGPTLIREADLAMYRVKAAGGNGVACFNSKMGEDVQEELRLDSHLRHALGRGELTLVFQPQVELSTGRVVGLEALMRWTHPELGAIPPSRFIPLAEENGLIVPMGEWAIERACRQIVSWRAAGLPTVPVAVNVSGRQLQRTGFEEMIADTLRRTGAHAHELEIELTETTVVDDPTRVARVLRRLGKIGVRAALDDFGTGYSSLSVLGRFPFARLKIDRSFVRRLPGDGKAVAITDAIVRMARALGMRTVAEGVERQEQIAGLAGPGCEEAQGLLFSPPLSPDDVALLLERGEPLAL